MDPNRDTKHQPEKSPPAGDKGRGCSASLRAYHNSHDEQFREPFGARPCGDRVALRLMVGSGVPVEDCSLCVEFRGEVTQHPMEAVHRQDLSLLAPGLAGSGWLEGPSSPQNGGSAEKQPDSLPPDRRRRGKRITGTIYEATLELPREPGLLWYRFKLRAGGRTYYYNNNCDRLGGVGTLSTLDGPPYQITVYKPWDIPSWFKNGVMYQIYVDRFFNGDPDGKVLNPKKRSLIHARWDDTPTYIRDPEGRVVRWSFFGGNLQGVIAKLPYLQELGVSIIYLNPIFEAASNHKYDTGDYLKIDPMYGDMETFTRLIEEAKKRGIFVILDGVFSHTGADSLYFNKFGNYPELGAFQAEISRYYPWYRLKRPGGEYECWWGEPDLPNVNELEPTYLDFILGPENGVARFWLRKGARGWRLDVADELPDEFIKKLRVAVKETDPEAVLIGEVWEDASNKVSYGERREYLLGDELDSVMNYPLREVLIDFMVGTRPASEVVARIMSLKENYPPETFRATMNLIGSHDRIRALTLLGDAPAEGSLTESERESFRLSEPAREKGVKRLKLLALLQMTLPGVPCLYYGDEAGLEGYSDPYNRGTYPWGREDRDLLEWHKRLVWMRNEYDVLREGEFEPFSASRDVFGFTSSNGREKIIVCVNRNQFEEAEVEVAATADEKGAGTDVQDLLVLDLLSGEKVEPQSSTIKVTLPPLQGKVFYIAQKKRESAVSPFQERSAGILLHITSLPSRWGIGDMGKDAYRFVDFLHASGQRLWQILPLNPVGPGHSPYQSSSVMAGNPLLISPDLLHDEGLLSDEDIQSALGTLNKRGQQPNRVDFDLVRTVKDRLFRKAWRRFRERGGTESPSYRSFSADSACWLDDYCLFMAIKKRTGGLPWTEWGEGLASRNTSALTRARRQLAQEIRYQRFLQYIFFSQWQRLRNYANSKSVRIIGDMPIYADGDSCDTWAHRELFKLDARGAPEAVAGVPPDYFSETGQLWGNPVYNWRMMENEDFLWWKNRVRQALTLCDYIRLDHFRGFEAYWEVPAGEPTAVNGRWMKGPGKKFFEALEAEFGELPFIAEDLGFITPEVRNLRNIAGLPGMGIYQFDDVPNGEDIYYSGTHDNDTLRGWCAKTGRHAESTDSILEGLYRSEAKWVIVPLQDVLGLGSEARMNTPGTDQGNWEWRATWGDLTSERSEWLRRMAAESGR